MEHSVANMFTIPLAIFLGNSGLTFSDMMVSNILPVALGNFVGGALFVGGAQWYIHGVKRKSL